MQRTEISSLGEFGLIDHLTQNINLKHPSSLKGVGDDCAVLNYEGKRTLVTSDMLLEGIHFDLTYVPLKHLGYKSVAVNVSDICAMNGVAKQIVLSIGVSKRFSVEDLESFYEGVYRACEVYNVDLVGGDTCSSLTGMTISVTCIGEAREEDIVYRNGAKATDVICVSGNLGAAYMGLQLLEREKRVINHPDVLPDFEGKEYILERQLKPEARQDIIKAFYENGLKPTSMMDISDGLASEILHICKQSHTGCRIYENKLPIDYQTALMAEEFNMNVSTVALNGGEDYELLFTLPLVEYEKIALLRDVHEVGYITPEDEGTLLITRDNQELTLKAQGWNHYTEE